jgi:hypothetical protein
MRGRAVGSGCWSDGGTAAHGRCGGWASCATGDSQIGQPAVYVTIPQIFTRTRGPLSASAHEVGTAQVRVLIGCVFVEIVIESETCHICRAILLTI